jgi:hypothetical protein
MDSVTSLWPEVQLEPAKSFVEQANRDAADAVRFEFYSLFRQMQSSVLKQPVERAEAEQDARTARETSVKFRNSAIASRAVMTQQGQVDAYCARVASSAELNACDAAKTVLTSLQRAALSKQMDADGDVLSRLLRGRPGTGAASPPVGIGHSVPRRLGAHNSP